MDQAGCFARNGASLCGTSPPASTYLRVEIPEPRRSPIANRSPLRIALQPLKGNVMRIVVLAKRGKLHRYYRLVRAHAPASGRPSLLGPTHHPGESERPAIVCDKLMSLHMKMSPCQHPLVRAQARGCSGRYADFSQQRWLSLASRSSSTFPHEGRVLQRAQMPLSPHDFGRR